MSAPTRVSEANRDRSLESIAVTGIVVVAVFVAILFAATFPGTNDFGWRMMAGGGAAWGWMWVVWVLLLGVPLFLLLVLLVALARPRAKAVPLVFVPGGRPELRYAGCQVTSDQYYRALDDITESRWREA